MQYSGTKLVVALTSLAFLLGATSWWYRYEAAHRASQFWGPEASRLIAEAEGFEALTWMSEESELRKDLSSARGQAHLRHALMSDRNYVWDEPVDATGIEWRWTLRFFEGERQVLVKLSEDLRAVGRLDSIAGTVTALSCEPMTESLEQYFGALGVLGVLAKPQAEGASGSGE